MFFNLVFLSVTSLAYLCDDAFRITYQMQNRYVKGDAHFKTWGKVCRTSPPTPGCGTLYSAPASPASHDYSFQLFSRCQTADTAAWMYLLLVRRSLMLWRLFSEFYTHVFVNSSLRFQSFLIIRKGSLYFTNINLFAFWIYFEYFPADPFFFFFSCKCNKLQRQRGKLCVELAKAELRTDHQTQQDGNCQWPQQEQFLPNRLTVTSALLRLLSRRYGPLGAEWSGEAWVDPCKTVITEHRQLFQGVCHKRKERTRVAVNGKWGQECCLVRCTNQHDGGWRRDIFRTQERTREKPTLG